MDTLVESAAQEVKGWVSAAYDKAKEAKAVACGVYEGGKDNLRAVNGHLGTATTALGVASVALTATGVGAPVAAFTGTAAGAVGTVNTVLNGVDAAGRAVCEKDLKGVRDMAVSYAVGKVAEKALPVVQKQLGKLTGGGGGGPVMNIVGKEAGKEAQALTSASRERMTHLLAKPALSPTELKELKGLMDAQRASAFAATQASKIELPRPAAPAAPPAPAIPTAATTKASGAVAQSAAAGSTAALSSRAARAQQFHWPELNLRRTGMTELVDKAGVPIRSALKDAANVRTTAHTVEQFYSNVKGFSTQVGNTFDWAAGQELQRFAERQGNKALTKEGLDTLGKALDATIANAEKAVSGKPEREAVLSALRKVREGLVSFGQAVGREGLKSIAPSNVRVGPDWSL